MPDTRDVEPRSDADDRRRGARANLLSAVGAWVGMVILAILNATFRVRFITPRTGEYVGHLLSTATLLALLAGSVSVYVGRGPAHTGRERVGVGVLWASLTVAFELLFGHYVAGDNWAELLALYDVTRGYVWVFVPLFLLVAPALYGRFLAR